MKPSSRVPTLCVSEQTYLWRLSPNEALVPHLPTTQSIRTRIPNNRPAAYRACSQALQKPAPIKTVSLPAGANATGRPTRPTIIEMAPYSERAITTRCSAERDAQMPTHCPANPIRPTTTPYIRKGTTSIALNADITIPPTTTPCNNPNRKSINPLTQWMQAK